MLPDGLSQEEFAPLVAGIVVCCLTPLHLGISIWICFMIQSALNRVPKEFRKIDPAMAWLRMVAFVPGVGALGLLVLNFFILPPTSKSIAAAAAARGDQSAGNSGTRMAWITCWLDVVASILALAAVALIFGAALSTSARGMSSRALRPDEFANANPLLLLTGLSAATMASLICLISLVVFCVWLMRINRTNRDASGASLSSPSAPAAATPPMLR